MIKSKTSEDIFDGFFDDEICTARTAHLLGRKKQIVGKMRVHKKRFVKVMALLVALAIGAVGVAIGLMFMPKGGVSVNDGYASVAYEVKDGETFAPDKGYTGLDVFGRLNWTFAHKTDWYGDMHGAVHTTVEQDIRTYKQFHDGVLISADITKSSLVNSARQFCYVPAEDRVIWREAACSPSEYKGFDTAWKTGAPTGNMTISGADGFRAKNGLPATELSVYIFREETILSAEPVKTNADGTYTITYTLDPNLYNEEDGSCTGAVAYYANQMMFSGGLTAKPEFTSVKVSYTFNDKWETLRCDTEEEYSATMGFTVGCKAEATTYYSYDVSNPPFEETDAFDSYFSEYVSKPATGVEEAPLDSMGAITSAFGKVISEPTTLYLELNIDDEPVNGLVYVDLHNGGSIADIAMDKIEIRAALGNLGVYLDGGAAYVAVGDWKLKLTISELMGMMGELMGADGGSSIDTQALLEELLGAPLTVDGGKANMHSEIALAGINIPLDFNYFIDEDENVTLDNVKTEININDITLAAQLGYSDQPAPAALENKEQFIELSSYIGSVMDIALAEAIHADISYDNADLGISISGGADVKIKGGIAAKAQVAVDFDGVTKNIGIAFDGSAVYIDIDGLKLSADVDNTMALVGEFVDLPEISLGGFDIAELIHTVLFTPVLTDNISITQESAEDMSKLAIALKGTELLKAFGLDFKLGDVKLAVSDGKIEGSAYGANIAVTPAQSFTVETDGYTEISDYAAEIAEIIEGGNLAVAVSYAGNDIEATGDLKINIKDLIVSGNVELRYKGVEKTIGIIYKDKVAYISLDGLKIAASVDEVVSLVKSLMPKQEDGGQNTEKSAAADDNGGLDLEAIIKQVLGLNLGDYITIGDGDNKLSLAIKGTELLKAFGLDFKLGDVKLAVSDGKIEGSAYGANIAITPAQAFTVETSGYAPMDGILAKIPALLSAQAIELEGRVVIGVKDKEIVLTLNGGHISWSEGFEAILDITIGEYGNIKARITSSDVQLAYGNIGVKLAFGDFDGLADTLFKAYSQLRDIVTRVLENNEENNPLPELNGISDLMGLLGDGSETSGALSKLLSGLISGDKDDGETDGADKLDIVSLINDMTIESGANGGFVRIGLYGLELELCDDTSNGGFARASLAAELDGVTVSAELGADIYADQLPAMPDIQYLDVEQLDGLLGYVTAAVNTLEKRNIGFNLSGTIGSDEEKYAEVGGIKYNFNASIDYCLADGQLLLIKLLNKSVVIDSSAYIKASVALEATLPEEDSLYLDITVYDRERTQESVGDGVLDFVVSISKFKQDDEKYDPLVFTAPADEIMTLLSGALKLFGIDNQTIDDFLVSKWLAPDVAAKFTALGSELMDRIKDMIGFDLSKIADLVNGKTDGATDTATAQSTDNGTETAHEYGKAVKALNYDKQTGNFNVIVDLGAILGGGLGDIELNLGRETGENPCLTALSLVNFKVNGTTVDFEAALTYDEVVAANPLEGLTMVDAANQAQSRVSQRAAKNEEDKENITKYYYDFDGADNLLISLVNSIVGDASENQEVMSGEPNPNYVVNRNFYIDGSVNADLFGLVDVTIDLVAISVSIDQNGDIGINLRLEYDGFSLALIAINGDSTVDITIKNNMVYMKRVQYTYFKTYHLGELDIGFNEQNYDTPVTLYRAMPLDSFMGDMLGQLGFVLNFGEFINNKISEAGTDPSDSNTTTEEVKDYGTIVAEVLKSYTYSVAEGADNWNLTLDGRSFSNGILGSLVINLSTGGDRLVRVLNIPMCEILLPVGNMKLTLSLNLTWHNPGGISDGAENKTDSTIAETVSSYEVGMGKMIDKLNSEGWAEKQFLEAEGKSLNFYLRSAREGVQLIESRNLMIATGNDGNASGTWYSEEEQPFPEIDQNPDEYYSVWDESMTDGYNWYAQQYIKSYQVTFLSDNEIEGVDWQFDGQLGCYKYEKTMLYGSRVEFIASGTNFAETETVTGDTTIQIPALPSYNNDSSYDSLLTRSVSAAIDENGAQINVSFSATLHYQSVVGFEGDNGERDIETSDKDGLSTPPSVDRYTFIGWFIGSSKDGWRKVEKVDFADKELLNGTLQAAWIYNSKLSEAVTTSKDYNFVTYKHTVSVNKDFDFSSAIVGALSGAGITGVQFKYYCDGSEKTDGFVTDNSYTESRSLISSYSNAQVEFKFTITIDKNNNSIECTAKSNEVKF